MIEICSLTCLFVYKVLNQEVLDDRGKFEVSLWKNEFWKVEDKISEDTFILLALSRIKVFLRACVTKNMIRIPHSFPAEKSQALEELQALSNTKPQDRRSVSQSLSQSLVRSVGRSVSQSVSHWSSEAPDRNELC